MRRKKKANSVLVYGCLLGFDLESSPESAYKVVKWRHEAAEFSRRLKVDLLEAGICASVLL